MAETLISVVLVGGVLVAALHTLGSSSCGQKRLVDLSRGALLAEDLIAEIMRQPYEDPGLNDVFGPETLEVSGTRASFDDVDDYSGWLDSPLTDKAGTALTNTAGWTREVEVAFATPGSLNQNSLTDQGLKRITVIARKDGAEMARLTAVRADDGASSGADPPVQTR
jgi:hypothetical protein